MPKTDLPKNLPPDPKQRASVYTIRRYKRFWAIVGRAGQLVCLTVYKRGATEVVRRLVA